MFITPTNERVITRLSILFVTDFYTMLYGYTNKIYILDRNPHTLSVSYYFFFNYAGKQNKLCIVQKKAEKIMQHFEIVYATL